MKIAIIGTGFVGLTHAAVCAEWGHRVIAYDIDARRIAAYASGRATAIERYVSEPGLSACVRAQLGTRLKFTSDSSFMRNPAERPQVIFLCLPTPPRADGSANLGPYQAAVQELAAFLAEPQDDAGLGRVLLVNKSTVPIGTTRQLARILAEAGAHRAGAASNPEFLPQGCALQAARAPDRIVVGTNHEADRALLHRVYAPLLGRKRIPYIETTPETAEAIKYVSNALLFTYVSFWNGVAARLAEATPSILMEDLERGVVGDARISTWGTRVGNGAGGSCFGKDLRCLAHQLEGWQPVPARGFSDGFGDGFSDGFGDGFGGGFGGDLGDGLGAASALVAPDEPPGERWQSSLEFLRAVERINEYQKTYLIERAIREAQASFGGATVALMGLAFKRNTNDMRDSSALKVIESLLEHGVKSIRAHDPVVDEAAAQRWLDPARNRLFARISYYRNAAEAMRGSDMLFISTDWDEYRELGDIISSEVEPPYLILDGRRMLANWPRLVDLGYRYLPVGGTLLDAALAKTGEHSPCPLAAGRGKTRAA